MADIYYLNGEFVPSDKAVLPLNDLAVLRGYGVFDFLRTYGGRPFFLDAHIDRLVNSAKSIGLNIPWEPAEIRKIIHQTLTHNDHSESNIRMIITGGHTSDFILPDEAPRLIVMVTPLHRYPDSWYENGVKIISFQLERHIPEAKSLNYIPAIMALTEAKKKNAVEAVYKDRQGRILEGTTSNIFFFIDDKLVTPGKDGILQGITRRVVLEITKDDFDCQVRDMTMADVDNAQEIFLSASNKEIVPVTCVDDTVIGDGRPGGRTHKLMERFKRYGDRWARGEISENMGV